MLPMSDCVGRPDEWVSASSCSRFGGHGHPLYFAGKKASRISQSTSHAETNAAVGTAQVGGLIQSRLTEMFGAEILGTKLSLRTLSLAQEHDWFIRPCDSYTDCMDLFELVTGVRGCPNDKSQRIGVLFLREDRITGRLRHFVHAPTQAMLCDGLTKPGTFVQLLKYCSTGYFEITLATDKFVRVRSWARIEGGRYTEEHLRNLSIGDLFVLSLVNHMVRKENKENILVNNTDRGLQFS